MLQYRISLSLSRRYSQVSERVEAAEGPILESGDVVVVEQPEKGHEVQSLDIFIPYVKSVIIRCFCYLQ